MIIKIKTKRNLKKIKSKIKNKQSQYTIFNFKQRIFKKIIIFFPLISKILISTLIN